MKTKVCLKNFVNSCLWKQFLLLTYARHLNVNLLNNFWQSFNPKEEQPTSEKVLKFHLFDNCVSDFFTEVKIWY